MKTGANQNNNEKQKQCKKGLTLIRFHQQQRWGGLSDTHGVLRVASKVERTRESIHGGGGGVEVFLACVGDGN